MESGPCVLGARGAQGDPALDGAQAHGDRPQPKVRATRLTAGAAEAPCGHLDRHRGCPGTARPAADVRRARAARVLQPAPVPAPVPASRHDGLRRRAEEASQEHMTQRQDCESTCSSVSRNLPSVDLQSLPYFNTAQPPNGERPRSKHKRSEDMSEEREYIYDKREAKECKKGMAVGLESMRDENRIYMTVFSIIQHAPPFRFRCKALHHAATTRSAHQRIRLCAARPGGRQGVCGNRTVGRRCGRRRASPLRGATERRRSRLSAVCSGSGPSCGLEPLA